MPTNAIEFWNPLFSSRMSRLSQQYTLPQSVLTRERHPGTFEGVPDCCHSIIGHLAAPFLKIDDSRKA